MEPAGAETGPSAFSLVDGGPFNRLCRMTGLLSPPVARAGRRALALTALAWLPMAAAAAAQGGGRAFLLDPTTQARLLLALPLMILAEPLVHERTSAVPALFVERGLVPGKVRSAFDAAFADARILRDGPLELILFALIVAVRAATWAPPAGASGLWYEAVCLTLYQFLLLRWLARLLLWTVLLWRLSRLELSLAPAHPDRAGGLAFLGPVAASFGPLLFSQSALLAAMFAEHASGEPAALAALEKAVAAVLAGSLLLIIGPLLPFALPLIRRRREELRRYGSMARGVVDRFEGDWLAPGVDQSRRLALQEYGSLEQVYDLVERTRMVPFGRQTLLQLTLAAAAPWVPVALLSPRTVELLKAVLKGLVM